MSFVIFFLGVRIFVALKNHGKVFEVQLKYFHQVWQLSYTITKSIIEKAYGNSSLEFGRPFGN